MRRNRKVIAAFKCITHLRERAFSMCCDHDLVNYPAAESGQRNYYANTPEGKREQILKDKFGIGLFWFPDPSQSYEEIVSKEIEGHWFRRGTWSKATFFCLEEADVHSKGCNNNQEYTVKDYEVMLQVGDLKEQGHTDEQIAAQLFAREYREHPDSSKKQVNHCYQNYRRLVDGDYANI